MGEVGEVGGCHLEGDSAWWLLQLAVEKPWSVPGGPLVCFLAQTGIENASFTLEGLHFGILGSFLSGGAFYSGRVLTNECSLMSGYDQCHEPAKDI